MTYYDELGLKPNATNEEIRSAYRRKAKNLHPDRGGDAAKMVSVNRAYEALSNPQRRLTYDRTGTDAPIDNDPIARGLMLSKIMEWIQSPVTGGNLIDEVGRSLLNDQNQQMAQVAEGTRVLARFEKRIKRLKFKGKGSDLVTDAVNFKIMEIKQQIEQLKDRAANLGRAIEMLAAYEYEPEIIAQYGHSFFVNPSQ